MLKLCMKLKNGQDVLFTLANGQTTRRYLILTDEEIEKLKKYQSNPSKYGYRHAVNELTGNPSSLSLALSFTHFPS